MFSKFSRQLALLFSALMAIATFVTPQLAEAQSTHPVIVAYKQATAPRAGVRSFADEADQNLQLGSRLKHSYSSVINGFAAELTNTELDQVRKDPRYLSDTPDAKVSIYDTMVRPQISLGIKLHGDQVTPTGVSRVEAPRSVFYQLSQLPGFKTDKSILINDTGVALHPDLNVGEGIDCITGTNNTNDGFGHGTHVAGIAAARNNRQGVVGVAPGVMVHPGRMFDNNGSGTFSAFICVNDWAAQNAQRLHIVVANMSITGGQPSDGTTCANTVDAIHLSVCGLIKVGIVPVVAAGNDGHDFINNIPANYQESLTVTAYDDEDGKPGSDFAAGFSNFTTTGSVDVKHLVAAPGVNINSTLPPNGCLLCSGSSYGYLSGTSMSTPHVVGTMFDCIFIGRCRGTVPQKIQQLMQDASRAPASFGFVGDPHQPNGNTVYGFAETDKPN